MLAISVFVLSAFSLLISLKLFWNMGIFVDEHGTSPDVVNGGKFWLLMDWLRLAFLFLLCLLSGVAVIRSFKRETSADMNGGISSDER